MCVVNGGSGLVIEGWACLYGTCLVCVVNGGSGLVIEGWACLCVQVWDMFGVCG